MKYTQSTCETAASQSFSRTREHTVMAQESTLKCTVSARIQCPIRYICTAYQHTFKHF